jgi:hypothetical protein
VSRALASAFARRALPGSGGSSVAASVPSGATRTATIAPPVMTKLAPAAVPWSET